MLVLVVDERWLEVSGAVMRMRREIARGVDLVYSADGDVELGGKRYRLEAHLIPVSEPSDEEEAPPADGP